MRTIRRIYWLIALLAAVLTLFAFRAPVRSALSPLINKVTHRKSVADRLAEFGDAARERLKPYFARGHITYPPARVTLLAVKANRSLEIYAADQNGSNRWIRSYPILAASGSAGPKLRDGDGQVPEGIYPIESLNPNSQFHVALRVGYPNQFDRDMARNDRRADLGGDIMIHGNSVSIGCLAMGDEAAEDLFTLAADTGLKNIRVVSVPVDFRASKAIPKSAQLPNWSDRLYADLKTELTSLPLEDSK